MNSPIRTNAQLDQALLNSIPEGLRVESRDGGTVALRQAGNSVALGCRTVFVWGWAFFWMVGFGVIGLLLVRSGGWFLLGLPVVAGLIGVGIGFALFVAFGVQTLCLEEDAMVVETRLFGFRRRRIERRDAIVGVEEAAYRDEDRSTTWSLHIYGERKVIPPFTLSPEANRWLGELIARWAGVEFRASLEREWQGGRPRK